MRTVIRSPMAQESMATGIDVAYTSSIPSFSEPVMSKAAVFTMKPEPERARVKILWTLAAIRIDELLAAARGTHR